MISSSFFRRSTTTLYVIVAWQFMTLQVAFAQTKNLDLGVKRIAGLHGRMDQDGNVFFQTMSGNHHLNILFNSQDSILYKESIDDYFEILDFTSEQNLFTLYYTKYEYGIRYFYARLIDISSGKRARELEFKEINIDTREKVISGFSYDHEFNLFSVDKKANKLILRKISGTRIESTVEFVVSKELAKYLYKEEVVFINNSSSVSWKDLTKPAKLYYSDGIIYVTSQDLGDNTTLITLDSNSGQVSVKEFQSDGILGKQNSVLFNHSLYTLMISDFYLRLGIYSLDGSELKRYLISGRTNIPFMSSKLVQVNYLNENLFSTNEGITYKDIDPPAIAKLKFGDPVVQVSDNKDGLLIEIGGYKIESISGGSFPTGGISGVGMGSTSYASIDKRIKRSFYGYLDSSSFDPISKTYDEEIGVYDKAEKFALSKLGYVQGDDYEIFQNGQFAKIFFWDKDERSLSVTSITN